MDFAPYQDTTPESTRTLSPPPNRTSSPARNARSPPPNRPTIDPFGASSLPEPSHFSDEPRRNTGVGGGDVENGRLDVNLFETSLPLRLDYEAMLAYLLLPPAGGVFLLVVEHKSDYVRYVKLGERGVFGTKLLPVKLLWNSIPMQLRSRSVCALRNRLGASIAVSFCLLHAYTDKTS